MIQPSPSLSLFKSSPSRDFSYALPLMPFAHFVVEMMKEAHGYSDDSNIFLPRRTSYRINLGIFGLPSSFFPETAYSLLLCLAAIGRSALGRT